MYIHPYNGWSVDGFTVLGSASSSSASIPWNSNLDEFAVWNRTLNGDEIKDLNRLRREPHFWYVNASDLNSSGFNGTYVFNVNSTDVPDPGDSCTYTSREMLIFL